MSAREKRIAALQERLRRLKNCQQRPNARRRRVEGKRERRADLRWKLLVGPTIPSRVEQRRVPDSDLLAWLDEGLTSADYRAPFGL